MSQNDASTRELRQASRQAVRDAAANTKATQTDFGAADLDPEVAAVADDVVFNQ